MIGFNVAEQGHVVNIKPPVDLGGSSATSDYFCLKNYHHASIIITRGAGTSATTLTVYESQTSGGTTEATIAWSYYAETTAAGDTLAARAAATTAGVSIGTTNNTTYVIEIDSSELTDTYPYLCVKFSTANSCVISGVAVLSGGVGEDATQTAIT